MNGINYAGLGLLTSYAIVAVVFGLADLEIPISMHVLAIAGAILLTRS